MNLEKIKTKMLLVSVFVTGAAFLVIEIIAIRILSPYYGNTIYTTSSVIGIMLAMLSVGYYLGGILSDKYPNHEFFYSIIFLSGLLIISMHFLGIVILPYLSLFFSIALGPFISSLLLFSIPAFFLGTLSPFAVKLNKKGPDDVGKQSGEVFFWSTLGSITGSFLTGFFLITYFGINTIVISTGISLILWSLFCFLLFYKIDKKILSFVLLFLLLGLFLVWMYFPEKQKNIIYERDGTYEKIKIVDGTWNNRPTRFVFLDRSHSSAMYLDSRELVFDYTKYYELYKLFKPQVKNAFVIGGGAYSIPKAILNESPNIIVDVSEIEPTLFSLAQKYFDLEEDIRLNNFIEDGRRFLSKNENEYDLIVGDVYYSFFSMPVHFTTKEFFSLVKNRLSDDGIFVGNFSGTLENKSPSLILSEIKTFKAVFPNSYFFAVDSKESLKPQNIIFLGINGSKKIDFDSNLITKSDNPILKNLKEKKIELDNFDFSKHKELTDNFSPIEYLVSKSIGAWY